MFTNRIDSKDWNGERCREAVAGDELDISPRPTSIITRPPGSAAFIDPAQDGRVRVDAPGWFIFGLDGRELHVLAFAPAVLAAVPVYTTGSSNARSEETRRLTLRALSNAAPRPPGGTFADLGAYSLQAYGA